MDDTPINLTGIPEQYQIYITWALLGWKLWSEFTSSVRNGGGLKQIIVRFWNGENLPKVIAEDYKKELTNPPFPPKSP